MKQYVPIMLLFSVISTLSFANTQKAQSKLFLVGGGLKSCSSMAIKNCNTNALANNSQLRKGKSSSLYKIDKKTINYFKNTWPEHFDQSNKQKIIKLLRKISPAERDKLLSKTELKSLLANYDQHFIISKLNSAEYYFLLDSIEQPVLKNDSAIRLKEHVDLFNSTNQFSTRIYQEFVTLAKQISAKKTPKILIITASARDPFEAVDFYQSVFTQAGADSQWLPLDATLNTLIQQQGSRQHICQNLPSTRLSSQGSVNREYVYPDLTQQQLQACLSPLTILKEIADADGIFINGGDQSLTLKAFVNQDGSDNKALMLIKNKLANNTLVIGGTSAGTAVMSGGFFNNTANVMITNGQSSTAIARGAKKNVLPQEGCQKSNRCDKEVLNEDLTYNEKGGLGLFHWGIMDTHFSERGRQGRLAELALATNARFSFGVDEATALVVSSINTKKPNFSVIGQSGVFIIENTLTARNEHTVLSHYLTNGDSATLTALQLDFKYSPWKFASIEKAAVPLNIVNIFEGQRYRQTAEILCRTGNTLISMESRWENTKTTIMLEKTSNAVSRYGVLPLKGSKTGYCSYQNYQLSFVEK